jgi:superfamily II DNA or RNA helicase
VVDECHHVAAVAYEHSVAKIAAQFWLGLTATPVRRDGLDDLVVWQLGPVRHTLDQAPDETLVDLADGPSAPNCELHVHETSLVLDQLDSSAPAAISEAHRALVIDSGRNAQIVGDVHQALGRGRNCLVLARRVAHVEILAARLAELGHEPLVLQGGMSTSARRATVERLGEVSPGAGVLVIGTTPFIGEGFDAPALDTLFLVAPISFDGLLVQCVGRVIRAMPGKDLAEVHDYHDVSVPLLAGALRRRMPGYRKLRFAQVS